jgi:hypothetical protein
MVEDLVRDMGCHTQLSHPRCNRAAEIMEDPSPDARDLIMLFLGGAEVPLELSMGRRKDQRLAIFLVRQQRYHLPRQVDEMRPPRLGAAGRNGPDALARSSSSQRKLATSLRRWPVRASMVTIWP